MTPSNTSLTVLVALITALIAPLVVEWVKVKFIHKHNGDIYVLCTFNMKKEASQKGQKSPTSS